MATLSAANQQAQLTLFVSTYGTCRTLRDIIDYIDGTKPHLAYHPHMKVSRELIEVINLNAFPQELRRWREIFAEPWQQLIDGNRIVTAVEEQNSRTIAQLVQIHDQTSLMIRALEQRLFQKLQHAYFGRTM